MSGYQYYPGCSLKGTGKPYEESLLAVAEALDIRLDELPDWNCCGATAYMAVDELQATTLATRNLAIAAADGRDLIAPCNACWLVLSKTAGHLADDPGLCSVVCGALQATCTIPNGDGPAPLSYDASVPIRHPLDVLVNDVGVETVAAAVTEPLEGLTVAPYYGCQIVRPLAPFDDQYDPVTMDRLLEAAGCDVLGDYPFKTRCCGASQMMTMPDVGVDLVAMLLEDAIARGADVIAVACPLCQFNLEAYQSKAFKRLGKKGRIPILYFTQLLGLAMGLSHRALGLQRSFVDVKPVLAGRSSDA
ncbi:MAG: CoB--CoM heterodisulfide reductase iron-sulfur subunit B family protein [Actinobacteria bacterium]|nr:CoB--CoM heterodisulfide reductase iron-sulfur subunit B family protein [Actinomycetota bacterium]